MSFQKRIRIPSLTAVALGSLVLSGCASFSPDGGMKTVGNIAGNALGKDVMALRTEADETAARNRVEGLLKKRLTADAAVQIALSNNRDLQAAYNALGISEALMVGASLPPNPSFSISRIAGGSSVEVEARAVGNVLALVTLPARADIAKDRFRQAKFEAAEATLRIAAETRRSYYRAIAAASLAGFLKQAQSAAESAAQLSSRLGEAGTLGKLDQARNQAFYAELSAQLATARLKALGKRERLIRAMGLWGNDLAFKLPTTLPKLPARAASLPAVEIEAVAQRLDLRVARLEAAALAKSYGLTNATRVLNLLEVAGVSKTTRDDAGKVREQGVEVDFEIPIFDFGQVKNRQAEQTYMQAVNRLAAKAVNVRSQARVAYQTYRASYDIARHYQREVLPLRKIISDETLLRYNAMQIDVFSLLTEARQRITSNMAAIEAERDFWLAQSNLGTAILGGGADDAGGEPQTAAMAGGEATSEH